jgi:hypothetical protein
LFHQTKSSIGCHACCADAAVEEEVQRVRLKNIHLANTLSKLEANIRAKEELAEGLHLIDFEQLKIENQSLNEKIEERNEELLKLRKKLTNTVQVGAGLLRSVGLAEGCCPYNRIAGRTTVRPAAERVRLGRMRTMVLHLNGPGAPADACLSCGYVSPPPPALTPPPGLRLVLPVYPCRC